MTAPGIVQTQHGTCTNCCRCFTTRGLLLKQDKVNTWFSFQVAPITIHPAHEKAANYFGFRIVHVPVGKDFVPKVSDMENVGQKDPQSILPVGVQLNLVLNRAICFDSCENWTSLRKRLLPIICKCWLSGNNKQHDSTFDLGTSILPRNSRPHRGDCWSCCSAQLTTACGRMFRWIHAAVVWLSHCFDHLCSQSEDYWHRLFYLQAVSQWRVEFWVQLFVCLFCFLAQLSIVLFSG